MNLLDCLYIAINRIKKECGSDSNSADVYSIKIDNEVHHNISAFNIKKEDIEKIRVRADLMRFLTNISVDIYPWYINEALAVFQQGSSINILLKSTSCMEIAHQTKFDNVYFKSIHSHLLHQRIQYEYIFTNNDHPISIEEITDYLALTDSPLCSKTIYVEIPWIKYNEGLAYVESDLKKDWDVKITFYLSKPISVEGDQYVHCF